MDRWNQALALHPPLHPLQLDRQPCCYQHQTFFLGWAGLSQGLHAILKDKKGSVAGKGNNRHSHYIPAIKKIVPADTVPMVYRTCSYITNITSSFASDLKPTFILPQTVCLTQACQIGIASGLAMRRFKGVYLLEQVEIAFVTAFQSLICLFASENFCSTLKVSCEVDNWIKLAWGRTSRRQEFFVARSEFQCSSWPGPINQVNNLVFSSSVQCLAPWTLPSMS